MVDLTNQVQSRLKITRFLRKTIKKRHKNDTPSIIQSQKITEETIRHDTKRKLFKDMFINNKHGM